MSHSTGSSISVCLLTYNHVDLIDSTLDSVLNQTIDGYEVVVSDDCSDDGTWQALTARAASEPRIRLLRTPRNLGMAANANYAVARCSRPYIALLHHDDLYREDLLERWARVLNEYADVAFVFNPYAVHKSDYVYRDPIPEGRLEGRWLLDEYLLPRWGCLVRGTAMVRKKAWDELGGMRERFGVLADVDLWMRLARSWAVGYVDEPLIIVRQERPAYYPTVYQTDWSWSRLRLRHEIHAANRLETFDLRSLQGQLSWRRFRWRLSADTAKWLIYALVRGRREMISSSDAGETDFDLAWLRAFRWLLRRGLGRVTPASSSTGERATLASSRSGKRRDL